MSEVESRIREILSSPQLAGFATITEDGKPWVRYVMAVTDESLTIRFASMANARKVAQIQANPEVHLTCGVTDPMTAENYIQVQGQASFTTDEQRRHAFWFPMLAQVFSGPDDPNYGVVEIQPYRIELVTAGSLEPEVWTPQG